MQRHDDLFKRRISCTFSDTVDGTFDLTSPCAHTSQTIGHCHPQVIMTVGRNDAVFDAGYIRQNATDHLGVFVWGGKAYGVGDIEGGCTFGDDGGQQLVSLVDRLLHKAEVIAIEGESYRLKEAKQRAAERDQRRKGKTKP